MKKNKWNLNIKAMIALIVGIVAVLFGLGALVISEKSAYPWLGISTIVFGILFIILSARLMQKTQKQEIDYRVLFSLGIIFFAVGISTQNPAMWILGAAFFAIGAANKNKWKKQKKWSEMSKSKKNIKIAIMIALGVLVLVGLIFFFLSL